MKPPDLLLLRSAADDPSLLEGRASLLEEGLRHPRCFVRRVSIECLTAVRPRGFRKRLIQALEDRCWEVRVAAAEGLEIAATELRRSPRPLIALLRDRSKLVRLQAAETLGIIGDPVARPALREILTDRSPLVRRYAAEALGRIGGREDLRLLEARFERERSPSAKVGICHGAYLLGADWALQELLSYLSDSDYIVRSAVAVALQDATRSRSDRRRAEAALSSAVAWESTPAKESMGQALSALRIDRNRR